MKNIVLIGMPGAGKSTLGVVLAKTLNMPFVDTDLIIQKKQKKLLHEIISQKGIDEFLSIEEKVIVDLDVSGSVIATGGSAVFKREAMNHLKENGFILYLKLPYMEIENRVHDITTRGIAMKKGKTLLQVYDERAPLYERYADKTIRCMGKTMEQLVEEIKTLWEEENAVD